MGRSIAPIAPSSAGSIRAVSMRDLMVVGAEPVGHDVGVGELVTPDTADGLKADRERPQPGLPGLGEQSDDQAESRPPDSRQPTGNIGDQPAAHGDAQRLENRVLPVIFGPVGRGVRGG